MELKDYVELLETVPATQLVMTLSFIMFLYFTMYGVFGDDPPIFKKKNLTESSRRLSRIYGMGALGVFLLSLLLPLLYQYAFASIGFFVDGREIDLANDDVEVVFIDKEGEVLGGSFEVRIARWHNMVELPNHGGGFSVYQGDLELWGTYLTKSQRIDEGGSVGPLQVSAEHGKVYGPLTLVDQSGRTIFRLPINDEADVIVPDGGKVEITNTKIHYHKSEVPKSIYIGPELDLVRFTTGDDEFFKENLDRTAVTCRHIDDKYKGAKTSSGIVYDPSDLVATSKYYPEGTIIEVEVPFLETNPVKVEIVGHNRTGRCVLSSGTFARLNRDPGNMKATVRIVDYRYKWERGLDVGR